MINEQGREGKKKEGMRFGDMDMKKEERDHFKKDEQVEVCLDEEGFRGSWYSATVIRTLKLTTIKKNLNSSSLAISDPSSKFRKIYLEFHNLTEEKDPSKPLRQYVDFLLVRPLPPREPSRSFQVSEEVDAFHHDGWWEGFIINILNPVKSGEPTRYSVYFRGSRELLVIPETDIRLHREWVYGNWDPPLEPPPPPPQHSSSPSH